MTHPGGQLDGFVQMFDKLGDLAGLVEQAQKVQNELKRVQAELADQTVEASAGGGMVTARVNGRQELVAIKIDPEAVTPDDVEMLEDLVLTAVNDGLAKAQEMANSRMGTLTGGVNLPGLM